MPDAFEEQLSVPSYGLAAVRDLEISYSTSDLLVNSKEALPAQ